MYAALVDVLGTRPLPRWGLLEHLLPASRPVLYGISPAILPTPTDWPRSRHVVGTWFLAPPDDWRPDADLEAFLVAGPAPVYVGFGSMGTEDPAATAALVLDAVSLFANRFRESSASLGFAREETKDGGSLHGRSRRFSVSASILRFFVSTLRLSRRVSRCSDARNLRKRRTSPRAQLLFE